MSLSRFSLLAVLTLASSCVGDPFGFWGDDATGDDDVALGEGEGEGDVGEGEGEGEPPLAPCCDLGPQVSITGSPQQLRLSSAGVARFLVTETDQDLSMSVSLATAGGGLELELIESPATQVGRLVLDGNTPVRVTFQGSVVTVAVRQAVQQWASETAFVAPAQVASVLAAARPHGGVAMIIRTETDSGGNVVVVQGTPGAWSAASWSGTADQLEINGVGVTDDDVVHGLFRDGNTLNAFDLHPDDSVIDAYPVATNMGLPLLAVGGAGGNEVHIVSNTPGDSTLTHIHGRDGVFESDVVAPPAPGFVSDAALDADGTLWVSLFPSDVEGVEKVLHLVRRRGDLLDSIDVATIPAFGLLELELDEQARSHFLVVSDPSFYVHGL